MRHWHLHCDEAGEFENLNSKGKGWKWRKSIIFGMMTPDEDRQKIGKAYNKLCQKHGFSDCRVHGKDEYEKPEYKKFSNELTALVLDFPVRLFRMTHQEDVVPGSAGGVSEAFACNRYIYMIQGMLEHLLFLHPEDYGSDSVWSLHPNNRVFPCSPDDLEWVKDLGFKHFKVKQDQEQNKELILAHVWDETGLRVFLNRLQVDYSPFVGIVGNREVKKIELPVASKSKDPLVHLVDNLAGIMMWERSSKNYKKLLSALTMDFSYSQQYGDYKALCHRFLRGDANGFTLRYLEQAKQFLNAPYCLLQLKLLLDKALNQFSELPLKKLFELEALADAQLQSSSGNWQFVSQIVEWIIRAVKDMPLEKQNDPQIQRLMLRLYSHKLSYHNHRGEVPPAWETVKAADDMQIRPQTIEEWRDDMEFKNRQAVTSANVFAFEEGNAKLLPLLGHAEKVLAHVNDLTGAGLKDPMVGKLRGTAAQNYAFLAPFHPEFFPVAEKIFLDAKGEFDQSSLKLRQNIYLAHLYLDWGDWDKIRAMMNEIIQEPGVKAFLDKPNTETSKYMSFTLSVLFKYWLASGSDAHPTILKIYTLDNLQKMFGEAFNEHPFEFITAYLASMAFAAGDEKTGNAAFEAALSIPTSGVLEDQVTIQAIRAEILTWWALALEQKGNAVEALAKIKQGVKIMTQIGENESLSPMLRLEDGQAVSGWFAAEYSELAKQVDEGAFDADACRQFLKCFTFNYR